MITSMSSNLSVSVSTFRHVFKFTMPWKATSPYEKRVMNDIQDGEASSVANCSLEHVEPVLPMRKIAFWIERTLFSTYLFSFPWRVRNNRVSLYLNLALFAAGPSCSKLIYACSSADTRSTNELFGSAITTSCHMVAIRTSRSLRYSATPKKGLSNAKYSKVYFTQSDFELHAVWGTWEHQKMELSNLKLWQSEVLLRYPTLPGWVWYWEISQHFQLTLWLAIALATVTWYVRIWNQNIESFRGND